MKKKKRFPTLLACLNLATVEVFAYLIVSKSHAEDMRYVCLYVLT